MVDVATAPEDNLADDILSLSNAGITDDQKQTFMVQLIPYLVDRDHKLFTHAYNAGRANS